MGKKIIKGLAVCLVWLAVWEIISLIIGKELLLPSPVIVVQRLIELSAAPLFWKEIFYSIIRIMAGYCGAVICGILLGSLCAASGVFDGILSPAARIIRATPVASFIMLLFVFTAKNNIPALTAFLMVMPVVWMNVYEGIKNCDRGLLEMAQVFRLKKSTVIKKIYVPEVFPFFISAANTGVGLAWKAGIAAEVLVNPKYGIGTAIHDSKIYLETADLFAWTLVVIIISLLLEKLIIRCVFKRTEK